MENNSEKRVFLPIGARRFTNIQVILDGQKVYEGNSLGIPEEMKLLKYSDVKLGDPIIYTVYSELN